MTFKLYIERDIQTWKPEIGSSTRLKMWVWMFMWALSMDGFDYVKVECF
jgi:hypothetical protein